MAGVLVGVATLTRQTWVIALLPAGYAAWSWGGHRLERPLLVLASAAATVGAVAFVVPFGPFWHWSFSGDSSVLALGESQNVALRGGLAFELFLLGNVATLWLVARRGWRREDIDLWLWLGTGLVAFVAGWRFFGHYWFQVLPPLCLLAGLGAAACRASVRRMLAVAVGGTGGGRMGARVLAASDRPHRARAGRRTPRRTPMRAPGSPCGATRRRSTGCPVGRPAARW